MLYDSRLAKNIEAKEQEYNEKHAAASGNLISPGYLMLDQLLTLE